MSENKWKIISDILKPVYKNKGCEIEQLRQLTYLSNEQFDKYIKHLSGNQYLEIKNGNEEKYVYITEKGRVLFEISNLKNSDGEFETFEA